MELNRFTSEELSKVLKVEILGASGVENLMLMFLTNESLIKDGDIKLQGLNTLDIIKQLFILDEEIKPHRRVPFFSIDNEIKEALKIDKKI